MKNNSITIEGIKVNIVEESELPAFARKRSEFMWSDGISEIYIYTSTGELSDSNKDRIKRTAAVMIWLKGKKSEGLRDIKRRLLNIEL